MVFVRVAGTACAEYMLGDRAKSGETLVEAGSGNRVVLDLFSNLKCVRFFRYFLSASRASDNSTFAIHGNQKNGDEE